MMKIFLVPKRQKRRRRDGTGQEENFVTRMKSRFPRISFTPRGPWKEYRQHASPTHEDTFFVKLLRHYTGSDWSIASANPPQTCFIPYDAPSDEFKEETNLDHCIQNNMPLFVLQKEITSFSDRSENLMRDVRRVREKPRKLFASSS